MATKLSKKAKEGGTYIIRYSFLDENEEPAAPSAMAYTLLRDNGEVVNELEGVELEPDTTVSIVLKGDDLALFDGDNGARYLHLNGTYDSTLGANLPYRDELVFTVEDLVGVEPVA